MSKALSKFNRKLIRKGQPPIGTGIGINTGPLVLGTMGANNRMQCSVLGDTVNLAARIEQLTRVYEASFLISERTLAVLDDPHAFSIRMVDCVAVKGKGEAVRLYEVLDAEGDARRIVKEATKDMLREAMDAYFALDFSRAHEMCTKAMEKDPIDPVLSMFASRSKQFLQTPPPDDWKGFEKLKHK